MRPDIKLCFISLERVLQYIDIEHEPKPTPDGIPPAYWPASGELKVEKLSARYSPVCMKPRGDQLPCSFEYQDGPRVLHEVTFEVQSGERVGIGMCPCDSFFDLS